MALPDHTLSSVPVLGFFNPPDDLDPQYLVDYELGGIGLNDASAGLQYQVWTARLERGLNRVSNIYISAPNHPESLFYTGTNISQISIAFDQNMNLNFAFFQDGESKFRWFDTTILNYTVTTLPAGSGYGRVTLDDKRPLETGTSDILWFYVRAGVLYYREQRDRYTIEYSLKTPVVGEALVAGMTDKLRVQIGVGLLDYPAGSYIYRTATGARLRTTTQGGLRRLVGLSYG